MENITMTNATQIMRAVSVCPQVANRRLIADPRVRVQGTAVSAFGTDGFGVDVSVVVAPAPAFYAPTHKLVHDVAHLRQGTPGLAPPDQVTSRPRNPTSGIRGLCVVRRQNVPGTPTRTGCRNEPNNTGPDASTQGRGPRDDTYENSPPDRWGQHEGGDPDAAHRTLDLNEQAGSRRR